MGGPTGTVTFLFTDIEGSTRPGLAAAPAVGSPTAIAYGSFTLALVIAGDDPTRAAGLIGESLAYAEAAGNDYAAGVARSTEGNLLHAAGDLSGAMRSWLDAAQSASRQGRRDVEALGLLCIAGALAIGGDFDAAALLLGWAQTVIGSHEDVLHHADIIETIRVALSLLPRSLGGDYERLIAKGAAMAEHEVLQFAAEHVPTRDALPSS